MKIKIEETKIVGFEPFFNKMVDVAFIDHSSKIVYPSHGYFYPHKYGKQSKKYANSIGYNFNNN